MFSDIVYKLLFLLLSIVYLIYIVKKFIIPRYAPVKKVKAEVYDIYKPITVSKYPGVSRYENYMVVFQTKDEKLSFVVSETSCGHYKKKKKGTLKYKGNRIISFQ